MTDYKVPAIVRANEVLTLLSRGNFSFAEILEQSKLPRSSVYGIIKTLEELGFVRLLESKKYALGFRLFELGSLAVAQIDLRREAMEVINQLVGEVNLTCHLGCLDDIGAFYLIKQQPSNSLLVNSWEGKRASLVTSGIGKALMAFQEPEVRARYLLPLEKVEGGLGHFASLDDLLKDFDKIKARGWALDNQEDSPHIRCVAAPIRDVTGKVIASISVTGPSLSLPDKRLPELAQAVMAAAARISMALGGLPQ